MSYSNFLEALLPDLCDESVLASINKTRTMNSIQREIKFRAFATKNGCMVDPKKITPLALADGMLEQGDGLFLPFRPDIILMQYIGQKDKNGREIYEGDIDQDGGQFIWVPDSCSFCIDYPGIELSPIEGDISEWCEIKGNIYEHPHLLDSTLLPDLKGEEG